MKFYRAEPTAISSWRLAILMGVNTRTYKFALGEALLELGASGADDVSLDDLAVRYAMAMLRRPEERNQAPAKTPRSDQDYLTVLSQERAASLRAGAPTDRLVAATRASIPGMVMVKFHNLRGFETDTVAHTFYRLEGRGSNRRVLLTPDLLKVAASPDFTLLSEEVSSRWDLVESAFDTGIGRSVITSGVFFDKTNALLIEKARRVSVTGARPALEGFQHGRCFYCHDKLTDLNDVHVDHVYPFSLMKSPGWEGPDLNGVWNLVVAHGLCNEGKLARLPTPDEVQRLIDRDLAILDSPHPLKKSISLATGVAPGPEAEVKLAAYFRQVDAAAHFE